MTPTLSDLVLGGGGAVRDRILTRSAGPALAGRGTDTFTDPVGDAQGGAPDISTITVTNSKGLITFRIATNQPTLHADSDVLLWLNTDRNQATGAPNTLGADYFFDVFVDNGQTVYQFARWTGSAWDYNTPYSTVRVGYANGATISVDRSELGDVAAFDFWVRGLQAVSQGNYNVDDAPDQGTYPYQLSSGTGTGQWWGGAYTISTGEKLNVFTSDSYPQDDSSNQKLADFFGSLVHGTEISRLTVYRATLDEITSLCGSKDVDGCYFPGQQKMYVPGENPPDGTSIADIATHEYGHHVATNRINPPWVAVDWGTKRWASYENVCSRAQQGTAFPGDEGSHYTNNPGEAFAESFRILNKQRAGLVLDWPVLDRSWFPDQGALDALSLDVTSSWSAATRVPMLGAFTARGSATRSFRLATPLDGALSLTLREPARTSFRLSLLDSRGKLAVSGARSVAVTVCGARSVTVRVTRVSGRGRFEVDALRP